MTYSPNLRHEISEGNSTTSLLPASNTFTGAWTDVTDFATLAVAINADARTFGTLWIDVSPDGVGDISSVPFTVSDVSFELPEVWNIIEQYIRIRYTNDVIPQTGFFNLTTKLSNGQELGLAQAMGDTINSKTSGQIVKSVVTGDNPSGDYVNGPASGYDPLNTTVKTLPASGVFTGEWQRVDSYAEIKISSDSDVAGVSCFLQFSMGTKGKLTFTGNAINNETFTIGARTYTFKTSLTSAVDEIFIGATTNDTIDNIVSALDRTGTAGTDYSLGTYANTQTTLSENGEGTILTIMSITDGELATTETLTNASWSTVTLEYSIQRNIGVPPQPNSLQTNFGSVHTLNPIIPFFRVVYTNGLTAQYDFELVTLLSVISGGGLISRSTQVLNKYNDVTLQRVVNEPRADRNFSLLNYQTQERVYGVNPASGAGSFETITPFSSGIYVFPTTLETLRVKSGGNSNDTSAGSGARTINVTFLDGNWEKVTETLTLDGTNASAATSSTAYRFLSAQVITSGTYHGNNSDDIIIENTSALQEIGIIVQGIGHSQMAIYTVPSGKTMYVTKIKTSVGDNNSADVRLWHVPVADNMSAPYSAKSYESGEQDIKGVDSHEPDTYLKFAEKTDVGFDSVRITGNGSAAVSVDMNFILVDNT